MQVALQGCWGAFVNTDSFTIGEAKEVFFGMRIFELAKQTKTLRHYVWSSLESVFRVSYTRINVQLPFADACTS